MQKYNENNTISLFIFRSNARGMQYGIGTYIHELMDALLKYPDINIFLISYNSGDIQEFEIKTVSSRFNEVIIPRPIIHLIQNSRSEMKYAGSVVKLISNLVPKMGQVIFQFNYLDDLSIIKKLKEQYNFPIISIVHFAQWQQIFNGNMKRLSGLNIEIPSNDIEYTLAQEREIYSRSDHIVSVTRYMKNFLINELAIKPNKISIIHNGLGIDNYTAISEKERSELKQNFGFGNNELIVLYSGRLDPCKGTIYLIEAFEEAYEKNPDLRLVLMGQGFINDCLKKIRSCFGKVTYTGFLPKEKVSLFYKIADIGIVPSIYDHCPYTVLEMMANRIPMIVSRIDGLTEILNEKQCFFIDPVINEEGDMALDIKELSKAILVLAENKVLRRDLAHHSFKNLKSEFNANRMAYDMYNLFFSLNRRKSGVRNVDN